MIFKSVIIGKGVQSLSDTKPLRVDQIVDKDKYT